MSKGARHRPARSFSEAPRVIVECELERCVHCGERLVASGTWHMRKYVQTMAGPVFVAGKSKKCVGLACSHRGAHYHASQVLRLSLPQSTYGLDVLAFIGWQHEHEHKQLVEIRVLLNQHGVEVSERHEGRLYRQFLALLGGSSDRFKQSVAETVQQHGGVIWGIDALQPEGDGRLLYVLYEVLSGTPVAGAYLDHPTEAELAAWLQPYQALAYPVLATLSDGEAAIIAALERCWPHAPRQRCQEHFLANLAEPVLKVDDKLRQWLREGLGRLPEVPDTENRPTETQGLALAPPFCPTELSHGIRS
jgi:hypothetical protein